MLNGAVITKIKVPLAKANCKRQVVIMTLNPLKNSFKRLRSPVYNVTCNYFLSCALQAFSKDYNLEFYNSHAVSNDLSSLMWSTDSISFIVGPADLCT